MNFIQYNLPEIFIITSEEIDVTNLFFRRFGNFYFSVGFL